MVGASSDPERCARLADRSQSRADRQLAGDEVRPSRGATRLGIVVGEPHPFVGELVQVRRPPGHDALVVDADVGPTYVVAHDENNVGLLFLGPCRVCGRETYDCADYERDREISTFPTKHYMPSWCRLSFLN